MRELNKIQKILIKQWFNKFKKENIIIGNIDYTDIPDELLEMIEDINNTEILCQCINQYLDELQGAI